MKGFYIDLQKDGSVRYRMTYIDPLTRKTKRVSVSMDRDTVRNRHAAEDMLLKRIRALVGAPNDEVMLSAVLDAYISDMGRSWRESTKNRNEASLHRVLRTFPQGVILSAITPQHWRDALSELSGDSPTTYNEYLKRLKTFLRWCVSHDYLNTDYTSKLARMTTEEDYTEDKATDKYLEEREVPILLARMQTVPRWHQIAKFMLLSGLRCGEALALEDSDVGSRFISVTKTMNANTKKIGPPKTKKSKRDVALTPELVALIAEVREYNQWLSEALGVVSSHFFFAEDADYCSYASFNKYLKESAQDVLGFPISTHWLRHTHASFLLAAGVPIAVISRRLGHETVDITQRVYIHIIDRLKDQDAALMSGISLLGPPASAPAVSRVVNLG